MQVLPGAPGTARQGRTRSIIVSTNDGGVATQPRAPGHERPRTASSDAARHDRPCATPTAPGADVPPATPAGAPGQYRLSAVPPAPDHDRSDARTKGRRHDRPLAALRAARHDRPCATPTAPLTYPRPPRPGRREGLPRVPANPRTLTYPHSHHLNRHSRASGKPRPPVATGGPPGGYAPATRVTHSHAHTDLLSRSTTNQVHLAIQLQPLPRSCSTACTGFSRQRQSRAPPPPAHRKPTYPSPVIPPLHHVERGRG